MPSYMPKTLHKKTRYLEGHSCNAVGLGPSNTKHCHRHRVRMGWLPADVHQPWHFWSWWGWDCTYTAQCGCTRMLTHFMGRRVFWTKKKHLAVFSSLWFLQGLWFLRNTQIYQQSGDCDQGTTCHRELRVGWCCWLTRSGTTWAADITCPKRVAHQY